MSIWQFDKSPFAWFTCTQAQVKHTHVRHTHTCQARTYKGRRPERMHTYMVHTHPRSHRHQRTHTPMHTRMHVHARAHTHTHTLSAYDKSETVMLLPISHPSTYHLQTICPIPRFCQATSLTLTAYCRYEMLIRCKWGNNFRTCPELPWQKAAG